ncbi:MAG: reverse transcriptase/maturase family protein [Gammaproteobacteria bacterium]|nr:reverse transcriptase/maturase family protein [Gammaproteobacteria bacterium]
MPVLQTIVETRKVKRLASGELQKAPKKKRQICYAAHRDAALYEHYAHLLSAQYEELLKKSDIAGSILAFRPGLGKCNIHFASEAFTEISKRQACVALAFDIKGFFDSLDHRLLKEMWAKVLGVTELPADHYQVYKSVTRYSSVDRDHLYKRLAISRHNPRASGRRRICSVQDFRNIVRREGLISVNQNKFGIPQGLPISAVLSNIYLLNLDHIIVKICREIGANYYRYCDDILIIAPSDKKAELELVVGASVSTARLELQASKSSVHYFELGAVSDGKPLQYLGFTFDGRKVLLRNSGITRYYSRMRAAVRLAHRTRIAFDKKSGSKTPLRTKKIFTKFTYLGRRSFLSYAFKSAKVTNSSEMKKQVKPHWKKVTGEITKKEQEYAGP